MDELTRFARVLVERLGTEPGGAGPGPISIAAIRREILPYRSERRNLGLSSVEDYETMLLRLVAEERGYVKTAPASAAERCRSILATPNPDLRVLEEIADTTIVFTSLAAGPSFGPADQRGDGPAVSPTPAQPSPDPKPPSRPAVEPPSELPRRQATEPIRETINPPAGPPVRPSACSHCNRTLPANRTVVFCPWCGVRLIPLLCERCGSEVGSSWRHCVTCGAPVRDPYRPG